MLEQLRQELSNRKVELEQIKDKVRLLGTNIARLFTETNNSVLFRKFIPKHQDDIANILLDKPLIIDLSKWPVREEFVLDLRRRYIFIVFSRGRDDRGEIKVKLLNTHFLSQRIANLYSLGSGDFIDAWERTKLPANLARSRIGFFYGEKITMTSAVASGSGSSSNTQIRGGRND